MVISMGNMTIHQWIWGILGYPIFRQANISQYWIPIFWGYQTNIESYYKIPVMRVLYLAKTNSTTAVKKPSGVPRWVEIPLRSGMHNGFVGKWCNFKCVCVYIYIIYIHRLPYIEITINIYIPLKLITSFSDRATSKYPEPIHCAAPRHLQPVHEDSGCHMHSAYAMKLDRPLQVLSHLQDRSQPAGLPHGSGRLKGPRRSRLWAKPILYSLGHLP